jgi:peptide/nickel transport system substrate-binding protein
MSELDYWNGRLIKGAISRREFMVRATALGASSLAISTLLASAVATAADAPKSGGVLKLGLAGGSTTDSLDFRTTTDSVMIDSNHGIWNCLAKWDQDGRPHPELAESWEPANGAKDWIVKLRKSVTFSNGKEFTADDAI